MGMRTGSHSPSHLIQTHKVHFSVCGTKTTWFSPNINFLVLELLYEFSIYVRERLHPQLLNQWTVSPHTLHLLSTDNPMWSAEKHRADLSTLLCPLLDTVLLCLPNSPKTKTIRFHRYCVSTLTSKICFHQAHKNPRHALA